MKRQKSIFIAFFIAAFLTGCGGSSSSTSTVPQATNPATQNTPQDVTPTTPASQPSGLPDLTGAVPVDLKDNTQYSGLQDLLSASKDSLFPPLVGDVKVVLHLSNSRATDVTGDMLLAFEDQQGFWGADTPSFPGTTQHTATTLDMIFANSQLVFRTQGTIDSSGTLKGSIYYRVRKSSDPQITYTGATQAFPACEAVTVTCVETDPATGKTTTVDSSHCPSLPTIDTATPCVNYMNLSDSNVKNLGTFNVSYSSWTTLSN